MANIDDITEEWVWKLHFEKRVDLNLQTTAPGESIKVEVGDIPPEHLLGMIQPSSENTTVAQQQHPVIQDGHSHSIPTNDYYLSSIVSPTNTSSAPITTTHGASGSCQLTPDCTCYKCQRQRRRAGARGRTKPVEPLLTAMNTSSTSLVCQQEPQSQNSPEQQDCHLLKKHRPPPPPPTHIFKSHSKELLTTEHPTVSSAAQQTSTPHPTHDSRTGSFILRKRPCKTSYERHFPQPTYSELDSIYRGQEQPKQERRQQQHKQQELDRMHESRDVGVPQGLQQQHKDSYEISWQDETGDDILPSLRTFQTIFDEKPYGNEGLSDLLESKTKELTTRRIQEKEQLDDMNQQRMEYRGPPRRPECLTLSYRNGPQHTQLTLYHTMKMNNSKDRMAAYDRAIQHCVRADSGLSLWIKKQSQQTSLNIAAPSHRPNFTLKKSTYRSILHLTGRKQKTTPNDLRLKTTKLVYTSSSPRNSNTVTPLDILETNTNTTTTANNYSPHLVKSDKLMLNRTRYENVDTLTQFLPPNRTSMNNLTLPRVKQEQLMNTAKPWSSLGRKVSKTLDPLTNHSVEKAYQPPKANNEESESFEKLLDQLCAVMTHVDRSVLQKYLEQANGDYMKTLSVIRDEVTSGKL